MVGIFVHCALGSFIVSHQSCHSALSGCWTSTLGVCSIPLLRSLTIKSIQVWRTRHSSTSICQLLFISPPRSMRRNAVTSKPPSGLNSNYKQMSVLWTGIPILLITANSQVTQVLESFPLGACPGHWSKARPPMSTYAEQAKPRPQPWPALRPDI